MKIASIKAYHTQFVPAKNKTANGPAAVLNQVEAMRKLFGRPGNAAQREEFTVTRSAGVKNIM